MSDVYLPVKQSYLKRLLMIDIFNYVCVSCNKPGVFFQSCALAIWNVARCKRMIYQMFLIIFYDQQCLSVCQMSTIASFILLRELFLLLLPTRMRISYRLGVTRPTIHCKKKKKKLVNNLLKFNLKCEMYSCRWNRSWVFSRTWMGILLFHYYYSTSFLRLIEK